METPCLVMDADLMEANLHTLQAAVNRAGKALRPHAKSHRCSRIAHRQVQVGAVGICVAKLREAEVLALSGITDILLTGPVADSTRLQRVPALLERAPHLMLVLDSHETARILHQSLAAHNRSLDILIDLDVGLHRTGIPPCDAVSFARALAAFPTLRLRGIQAYAGQVQHIRAFEERRTASLTCMKEAGQTFESLRRQYPACTIFTGGGTGTFDIDIEIPALTDLQAGSYALMDADYRTVQSRGCLTPTHTFTPPLRLLTTVIGTHHPSHVTVDAGLKTMYRDGASPVPAEPEWSHLSYEWFGDEYGRLLTPPGTRRPRCGDRISLYVSHCDPTVNLFDAFNMIRAGSPAETWPIDLRGCSQ
ncbi:MAG: hypothetical protein A2498_15900 [Lentisphaerae bacterium RIFOXYC12_FULL_60_16]|nr:MAG: hypothetical protein A2498_15900 [Lentisphaerae bacterium RIFOXYC12_FULL_60_16]